VARYSHYDCPTFGHLPFGYENKKADVAEYLKEFDHVGLLFNEPPGMAGLFFI